MNKFIPQLLTALCILITLPTYAQYDYDSVTFESPTTTILTGSGTNLWQIGTPQKTILNAAHTGSYAIITDTINTYPPNDTSSFIYLIKDLSTDITCNTCMEFWHNYDVDATGDAGFLDASYDGGNTWSPLIDTSFISTGFNREFYWENDLSGNNTAQPDVVVNGASFGWIKSRFCWQWFILVRVDTIIPNPDSLMVRFNFISDSIDNNKEGWVIDDIVTSSYWPQSCSSVNNIFLEHKVELYPNPASTELHIQSEVFLGNDVHIEIRNVMGQLVIFTNSKNKLTQTVNLEKISDGFYSLSLIDKNNNKFNRKFIKN